MRLPRSRVERRDSEGDRRVRIFERPPGRRHALGAHRPQPARARAHPRDRRLRSARDARSACRPHARGRAGQEAVRPGIPGSAGARDRPGALLRRGGRDRRRRGARAGTPGGRRGARRVRAARAGGRPGAGDRAGAAARRLAGRASRRQRAPSAERRPRADDPARRSRRHRRRHGLGLLRDRPAGSGLSRPGVRYRDP